MAIFTFILTLKIYKHLAYLLIKILSCILSLWIMLDCTTVRYNSYTNRPSLMDRKTDGHTLAYKCVCVVYRYVHIWVYLYVCSIIYLQIFSVCKLTHKNYTDTQTFYACVFVIKQTTPPCAVLASLAPLLTPNTSVQSIEKFWINFTFLWRADWYYIDCYQPLNSRGWSD